MTGAADKSRTSGESVFEQPLTERLRIFLRLDFLYSQAVHHNQTGSAMGTRAAVASLLDIIAVTQRGDVRADVLKELERNLGVLNEYQNRPGIDLTKLRGVISNLVRLRDDLANVSSNWLHNKKRNAKLCLVKLLDLLPVLAPVDFLDNQQ